MLSFVTLKYLFYIILVLSSSTPIATATATPTATAAATPTATATAGIILYNTYHIFIIPKLSTDGIKQSMKLTLFIVSTIYALFLL